MGPPNPCIVHGSTVHVTELSYACILSHSVMSLCDPMDCNLPGSSVHETFWERILKWIAISSCRESSRPRNWTQVSCISCIGRQILPRLTTWEALSIWYTGYVSVPPLFGIFCRIRPFLLILLLYSILWVCVALLFVLLVINGGSQGRTQTQTLSAWFSASRTEFVVFTDEPIAIQANFAVGRQQTCIRFILFALIFFFFFFPHPESLPLNLRGYVVCFPAYQGENPVCMPQPVVRVALERWGFNWFLPAFVGSSKLKSSPKKKKKNFCFL